MEKDEKDREAASLFTGGKHPAGLAGDWQGVS